MGGPGRARTGGLCPLLPSANFPGLGTLPPANDRRQAELVQAAPRELGDPTLVPVAVDVVRLVL